jgi:hypothetical protein
LAIRGVPKMKIHGAFYKRLQKSSLLEIHNVIITFHQHKYKKGIIKASRVDEI